MSNNKQSSVEQLEFDLKLWFDIMKIYFPTEIQNSINRSKAMHKEEIQNAFNKGNKMDANNVFADGEWYFMMTFGGNNEQTK